MGRHPGTAVAALTSLGAGAVHGAAIGIHAEQPQLARVFLVVGVLQIAWGVAMLTHPRRWMLPLGLLVNGGAVFGWLLTRLVGVSWIDGLETRENPQLADTLCAGLGAVAAATALGAWLVGRREVAQPRLAAPAFAVALLALPAMWTTTSHSHGSHSETGSGDAHAHDHSGDTGTGTATGVALDGSTDAEHGHGAVIVTEDGRVWPWAYDPDLGIDVSGVPGVDAEQESRAVALIERTLEELPRWSDVEVATSGGWISIGDGSTGYEHFVNRSLIVDGKFLDPTAPESLVYRVEGGRKQLVSAMFMASPGVEIDDPSLTDYAGPLMQWHKHDNLCFRNNAAGVSQVVGVLNAAGECPAGSTLGGIGIAMVHVWIVAHPCGPFAALEGEGAGRAAVSDAERVDMCASHDHDSMVGGTSSATATSPATSPGTSPGTTPGTSPGTTAVAAPATPVKDDGSARLDLSGMPGVSAGEKARAEDLVYRTRTVLPKFATTADAEAAGFSTIGDGGTGYEHYINWTYINDEHELDPDHPESLVYQVDNTGRKTLVSAMYMVDDSYTLDTVPNIGGPLTQWHIHNNLCFSRDPAVFGSTRVVGVTTEDGPCAFGIKLHANPMIHVWIVPHRCGPFAALEGVGAGQIKPGEERLCDHAHAGH